MHNLIHWPCLTVFPWSPPQAEQAGRPRAAARQPLPRPTGGAGPAGPRVEPQGLQHGAQLSGAHGPIRVPSTAAPAARPAVRRHGHAALPPGPAAAAPLALAQRLPAPELRPGRALPAPRAGREPQSRRGLLDAGALHPAALPGPITAFVGESLGCRVRGGGQPCGWGGARARGRLCRTPA